MGGFSLQITFISINETNNISSENLISINIGNRQFKLYTHSFMGFGLEAAQLKFIESDYLTSPSPCYPVGASFKNIEGSGNFSECLKAVEYVLPSKVQGIPDEIFLAIENFFYTSKFFDIDLSDTKRVLSNLEKEADKFCSTD